ncbi:MAG: uroporphyrinogen decarboxylase family protein, partial [Nitrososphaerota archaeon]
LDSFAELPEGSIVFHVDRSDIYEVRKKLKDKFCVSGGIPNWVLSVGTPEDVQHYCKKVIDVLASDGGYIMDASAIIQNDAKIENIKAMTEFTRRYDVYSTDQQLLHSGENIGGADPPDSTLKPKIKPGVCIPWEEKRRELPRILGDENIVGRIWEEVESFGYLFIWQILLSF